jgi:hypothetical protein
MSFAGNWKNRLGSEMVLQVTGNKVTGKYKSAVGEVDPSKEYDLEGFVIDNLVGFTALWADRKSITCWVDRLQQEGGKDKIHAVWHLGSLFKDEDFKEPTELWNTFLTNLDEFERI